MTVKSQDNNLTVSMQPPPGQQINVLDVSLGELTGAVPLPPYKAAQLVNLTQDDKNALIQLDPYLPRLSSIIEYPPPPPPYPRRQSIHFPE